MEQFNIGDIVEIPSDFTDESSQLNFRGSFGIVRLVFDSEDQNEEPEVLFELSAETLRSIPTDFLLDCFENEVDWSYIVVPQSIVQRSDRPFSSLAVEWEKNKIGSALFWPKLDRIGELINSVFSKAAADQSVSPYQIWVEYLSEKLKFPFNAHVCFDYEEEDGILQPSDGVNVLSIEGWDIPLGVFCSVESRGQAFILPLQDIAAARTAGRSNHRILEAYEAWLFSRM